MGNPTGRDHLPIRKNLLLRILFGVILVFPFFFYREFSEHIGAHFTGGALPQIVRQQWYMVITNIIIFLTFLLPLRFRRKIDWKEYGLVSAFFVSLFIEMYGIPLSILFISRYYGGENVELPNTIIRVNVLGVQLGMTLAMVYGLVLMILGTLIIILGWITLYRNLSDQDLVTQGIYSHSRHPQYFGFILVILGWLIGWPTILVGIFAPILIYKYVQVCRVEEKELEESVEYADYRKKVPFFI